MRSEQAQRQINVPPQDSAQHNFEEFTYTIAHDLNGPLRRIVNFTQLLEEKFRSLLDPQAMHYLDVIAENGHKAQAHVAGLLQYSRLGTAPVAHEIIDCKQMIDNCLHQLKADIESREALIHVGPMPNITGDSERLELLFYCLISNALKFCHDRPDITISAERGDNSWVFSVRDCGIVIESKNFEDIFGIFHRLHHEHEYSGNGMGLALAKRIAELHDGEIEVESHPGEGATFYVILPDREPIL